MEQKFGVILQMIFLHKFCFDNFFQAVFWDRNGSREPRKRGEKKKNQLRTSLTDWIRNIIASLALLVWTDPFWEVTRKWLESQAAAEVLLTWGSQTLDQLQWEEKCLGTDMSHFTFPFPSPLALAFACSQHTTAFGILTSDGIFRHVNESFTVHMNLLTYGPYLNFELFRYKFPQTFPGLCVWMSSSHRNRMATLW